MKTLIKRPNYTLSIKTSCYSAFSFYPFSGTTEFLPYRLPALINLLSFTTEAFLFCFTVRTHFHLIYRRESTALLIDEGRTKASSTKPLTKSEFTKA